MVASSTLLALFMTLVASSAAKDYLCGDNNQAKNSRRSGSWNYGTSTNPLENPMLVQLVYADKTRTCAGSLITDRHVLTARQCVDGVKPEDISVVYGPRTPYGGNTSVKSAKSPSDPNVDLAVLELAFSVEISDSTIPVCVGDTVDEKFYSDYQGLHFGPKNKSEDSELARAMYLDVLRRADEKECIEALGDGYHKDTQFCVGKRNQVFAEGVYTGGPILVSHRPSGRFLQVGIAIKADAENNYGSATRVTLYHKEISELTGCFLAAAGLNSTTPSKQNCDDIGTTTRTTSSGRTTFATTLYPRVAAYPRLVPLPEKLTYEEAEKTCLKMRGTIAASDEPHFDHYLKGLNNHEKHWVLYMDPLGYVDTKNEKYNYCWTFEYTPQGAILIKTSGNNGKSCNDKRPVVCGVADGEKCNGEKQLYFNEHCYKIVDSESGFGAEEGAKKCEEDGSTLASVHSDEENHAVHVNSDNTKHERGKVYDGSSFDYGFEECNKNGTYPWCPAEPDCLHAPATSVIMKPTYRGGKSCWDDIPDTSKCAALCKKKLS